MRFYTLIAASILGLVACSSDDDPADDGASAAASGPTSGAGGSSAGGSDAGGSDAGGANAGGANVGGGGSDASGSGPTSAGAGGAAAYAASGPVTGDAVPTEAEVVVVWLVSSGSPDYAYTFGDGALSGATFTVGLSSVPPAEALNSNGVGVGLVMLLEPGTMLAAGKIADYDAFEAAILGASAQDAIIWRDETKPGTDWSAQFPAGFGCGRCVPAEMGFDSFEPIDCTEVEVEAPSDPGSLEFCDWT